MSTPPQSAEFVDPFDVDFTYPPGQHPGVGPEHVHSCPRRSGANYCWCKPSSPPGSED